MLQNTMYRRGEDLSSIHFNSWVSYFVLSILWYMVDPVLHIQGDVLPNKMYGQTDPILYESIDYFLIKIHSKTPTKTLYNCKLSYLTLNYSDGSGYTRS